MRPAEFARRAEDLIAQAALDPALDDRVGLPLLHGERRAGQLLSRTVVAAALLTVLVSAACALLARLGVWTPWLAWPVVLALAAVAVRYSLVVTARALPLWAAGLLVLLALATTVWAGLTHSEQVLPRRDPGSYAQTATYLAQHHRTPVIVAPAQIGGPTVLRIDGVTLESPAFYQIGSPTRPTVQPQFMIGAPAWYSLGRWLGGVEAMLWMPAVFAGFGVLAVGLLTGSMIGPRWGPLGALGTALSFPYLHTARATYSEPLAVLVLAAGLLVLVEGTRSGARGRREQARGLGLIAGLLIGGGGLVRADALRETILLLPVAALLVIRRDGTGAPLLWGAAVATLASAAAGLGLASRYLGDIAASLVPLAALGAGMAALAAAVVLAARRGVRLPSIVRAWLPRAVAVLVVLGGMVLASRPLWQTVRQSALDPGARVVAGLQQRQGLPVDGGRTYAEQTLVWTSWWVGPVAVAIAFVVLAVAGHHLARAWVDGQPLPKWAGPYLVGLASAVLTWLRPGITPDHPWADRRLLVVLPLVAVCVVAAAAWLTRWSTRRLPPGALVLASVGTAATLLVPQAFATWPHARERVELGEVAAVQQVCRSFGPRDVALMVDDRAANEWPQVLRGQCSVPALSLTSATRREAALRAAAVQGVSAAATGSGRRLVLVAADGPAALVGGRRTVRRVLDVTVREDARLLEQRPDALVDLPLRLWLAATP